jgi:RND family efflux transporter MFP subunit
VSLSKPHFNKATFLLLAGLAAIAMLMTVACATSTSAAGAPGPPEVEVSKVVERDVPTYREWIGTLDGLVNAAIKAQVSGYLLTQNYTEGSYVRKGQLMFQIDPRPFQAAADQARGQLAQANGQLAQSRAQLLQAQAQLTGAEANQRRTQLDQDRYTPLAAQQAITQQDLDNATQNNLSAKAQVEAAKAQVETAKAQIQAAGAAVEAAHAALETANVNLGFTRLAAPINGIAGAAQIQVGNLVSPSGTPVTTVSTLDPIKADFTVSEQEYLALTRRDTPIQKLRLELILSDGSVASQKGKFFFADREVNQSTGSIQLTGLFPNPGNVLRPGQYAKVRAVVGIHSGALLVPQRAVTELQGTYQVAVVGDGDKISLRTVKVGDRLDSLWIVNEGLEPGERVVAEGVQKVAPGMQVKPKTSPAASAGEGGN